jgi:hypothetical protein
MYALAIQRRGGIMISLGLKKNIDRNFNRSLHSIEKTLTLRTFLRCSSRTLVEKEMIWVICSSTICSDQWMVDRIKEPTEVILVQKLEGNSKKICLGVHLRYSECLAVLPLCIRLHLEEAIPLWGKIGREEGDKRNKEIETLEDSLQSKISRIKLRKSKNRLQF